jgi:hypothetical protein
MPEVTTEEIREHVAVLSNFQRDYGAYIAAQSQLLDGAGQGPSQAERSSLMRRSPRAGVAMNASGVRLTLTPPPMLGGPVLTDFVSQVFAHEGSVYGGGPDPLAVPRMVDDGITAALGALDIKLDEALKNPQPEKPEPRPSSARRWPTLLGRLLHLPRWLGAIADIGGGIAVIVLVAKFVFGLG